MAFGQIDPARLEGDALRRWYLRSPAEIEDERRKAQERAYEDFFHPSGRSRERVAADEAPTEDGAEAAGDGFLWSQVGEHRWSGSRQSTERQRPIGGLSASGRARQVAARAPSDFWNDWTPCNTLSCHGRPGPSASPSNGGQSPLPPLLLPRTGGGSGGSRGSDDSRGEWSDKPECNQQFEADREICRKVKKPACWENQNKRLGRCNRPGGTIGDPPLRFGPPGR